MVGGKSKIQSENKQTKTNGQGSGKISVKGEAVKALN